MQEQMLTLLYQQLTEGTSCVMTFATIENVRFSLCRNFTNKFENFPFENQK